MSTLKVDTVRPVTTDGSLSLKGDSGGSATTNGISVDSSGDTSITGNLKFDSGYGSAETAYGCRAWVNFDGTFGTSPFTIANGGIRASGNVSSVTDNGTGIYTVNFATDMRDVNYAISGAARSDGTGNDGRVLSLRENTSVYSESSFKIHTRDENGTLYNSDIVTVAVFR